MPYKNKADQLAYQKKHDLRNKLKALVILGNKCSRCGEEDIRVLQFDHINGGGSKDRKNRGNLAVTYDILRGITEPYQILCANCNCIKRHENKEMRGLALDKS